MLFKARSAPHDATKERGEKLMRGSEGERETWHANALKCSAYARAQLWFAMDDVVSREREDVQARARAPQPASHAARSRARRGVVLKGIRAKAPELHLVPCVKCTPASHTNRYRRVARFMYVPGMPSAQDNVQSRCGARFQNVSRAVTHVTP